MTPFFGKYRGTVIANVDPLRQGRLRISCPAVLGDAHNSWALPCVPYAGDGVGLVLIPPPDAWIWVEFEGGDPEYPIWSGCFWGPGQFPAAAQSPAQKLLRTDGLTVTLDDTPNAGGFSWAAAAPAVPAPMSISCAATGIELVAGEAKVALGNNTVSLNNGALEVT